MTLAEARPQEDPPTVTADETTAPVEAEEYEEYDDEPEVTDTRMGRGFGVIAVAALIVALASAVTAGATVFYILESTTRSEERTAQLVAALKEPQSYALQGSAGATNQSGAVQGASRANPVPPQPSRVSLAHRLRQARLNPVPPALVVPHRGNRARNPRLSQAQPVQAALHKDRQPRPQRHHQARCPPHSKLHPSRQRRPQQLQPQCLPPTYCCKPPWPQPSLVSLAQS